MQEARVKIFGRVQMVMFRDFAQRKARRLGVFGYVRNLPDGSVEVIAQGDRALLESYIEKLHRGPILARVERVDVEWRDPSGTYANFTIVY